MTFQTVAEIGLVAGVAVFVSKFLEDSLSIFIGTKLARRQKAAMNQVLNEIRSEGVNANG